MKLSQAIEVYIAYKRSLGMGFRSEAVILHAFIKSAGDDDIRKVRPQSVRRYLDGNGRVTSFWFAKYHTHRHPRSLNLTSTATRICGSS